MLRIPTAYPVARWPVFGLLTFALLVFVTTGQLQAEEMKQARGLVKAQTRAILASEIAAIVTAVPKRTGDSFKKGETLVSFDCRIFKSQMAKVAADAKAARARLANSRDLEKMRSIGKRCDAGRGRSGKNPRRAGYCPSMLTAAIQAPFPGKVVELLVNRHESVDVRRNLIEIVSSETLEVEVIVPGRWLPAINPGQQVNMLIDETGRRAKVTIEAVSGAIDPVSQTTVLRGAILAADAADLLPGMSGVLTFGEATPANVEKLLSLEQTIRDAPSLNELGFAICNRTRALVGHHQAALCIGDRFAAMRVVAMSDIPVVERTAPLVTWLEQAVKKLAPETGPTAISAEDLQEVENLSPPHMLLLPLRAAGKGLMGVLMVSRPDPFNAAEMETLTHLADVYGHALAAFHTPGLTIRLKQFLTQGRRKWVALLLCLRWLGFRYR